MTVLPPSMIELARKARWDAQATERLDRLVLLAFDANGNLSLDDGERIAAVKAMRDAMWPAAAEATQEFVRNAMARGRGDRSTDATLAPEDLRLHHDVDESRRLEHASKRESRDAPPAADGDRLRPERHAAVVDEFQLVDDGRLAAAEFARFLRPYRAGSERADLNRDGRTNEADLRLFLDVARPIEDE